MKQRWLYPSLFVCLAALLLAVSCGTPRIRADPLASGKVTTVAIVRHAEKLGGRGDVALSPAGYTRASRLAEIFKRAQVDALFASERRRTHETLEPLGKAKELSIQRFQDPEKVVEAVKALKPGSFVVVAHHSNTIVPILEGLGVAADELERVSLKTYENLFLVTLHPVLETRVLNLSY